MEINNITPYMKISDAAKVTGLSMRYLRVGCQNNTVPHIMSGNKYYVNVPKLLEQLENESSVGSVRQ